MVSGVTEPFTLFTLVRPWKCHLVVKYTRLNNNGDKVTTQEFRPRIRIRLYVGEVGVVSPDLPLTKA